MKAKEVLTIANIALSALLAGVKDALANISTIDTVEPAKAPVLKSVQ